MTSKLALVGFGVVVVLGLAYWSISRSGRETTRVDGPTQQERPAVDSPDRAPLAESTSREPAERTVAETDAPLADGIDINWIHSNRSRGLDGPWSDAAFVQNFLFVRWSVNADGKFIERERLAEFGLLPGDVMVRIRSLEADGAEWMDYGSYLGPEGLVSEQGSAPISGTLFLNRREVAHVAQLGSAADHDPTHGRAELELVFDLSWDQLVRDWTKLVVRLADPELSIERLDLVDSEGHVQTTRFERHTTTHTMGLPVGRYHLSAMLTNGAISRRSLDLLGGTVEHILDFEIPGRMRLEVTTPESITTYDEIVIYPRDAELVRLLRDTWSHYGYPRYTLKPDAKNLIEPPPCPSGTYDVVLRTFIGMGGHAIEHLAEIHVPSGRTTEVPIRIPRERPSVEPVAVRLKGIPEVDVKLTSPDGRVFLVDRWQLRTPVSLPIGRYDLFAQRVLDPRAPLEVDPDAKRSLVLDVGSADGEYELAFGSDER